jgi:hypothetical protein
LALFATDAFMLVTNIAPDAHPGQKLIYYFLPINIATAFIRQDVFGEEYEEEEPKRLQLKKN